MWKIFARNTSVTHVSFWESIDEMPLFDWRKCMDGNIEFVNKEQKQHEANEKQWIKLHDQYLKKFGIGEKFKKYLKLIREKALLECDYVITKERFKLTEIDIMKTKIDALQMNFGNGQTIEQSLIHLSKWLGYGLKIKETTVVEFYTIVNEYGKWANKENGNRGSGSL